MSANGFRKSNGFQSAIGKLVKISQTFNELTIKETPAVLWVFGLFFAVIGLILVYGSLGGFTNFREIAFYEIVIAFIFGCVGVLCGLWIIFHAPITFVKLDNLTETIFLKRRGLFGNEESVYRYSEIDKFFLIEDVNDEGGKICYLGLKLKGGETVKISNLASYNESLKRDFVFQTNLFLNKSMPSYKNVLHSPDDYQDKLS